MADRDKNSNKYGSLFIPAGVLLGMGVGALFDNFNAGLFIGLGLGFVAYGIVSVMKK